MFEKKRNFFKMKVYKMVVTSNNLLCHKVNTGHVDIYTKKTSQCLKQNFKMWVTRNNIKIDFTFSTFMIPFLKG